MNQTNYELKKLINNLPNFVGYQHSKYKNRIPIFFCYEYLNRRLGDGMMLIHKKTPVIITTKHKLVKKFNHNRMGILNSTSMYHKITAINETEGTSSGDILSTCSRAYHQINHRHPYQFNQIKDDDDVLVYRSGLSSYQIRKIKYSDIKQIKNLTHDFSMNFLYGKIHLLLDSKFSAYKIAKLGHFSKSIVIEFRNHRRKLNNLSLVIALKMARVANRLYSYQLEIHPNRINHLLMENNQATKGNDMFGFNPQSI